MTPTTTPVTYGLAAAIARFGIWYFWWRYVRRTIASFVFGSSAPRDLILAELRGALAGPSGPSPTRTSRALDLILAGMVATACGHSTKPSTRITRTSRVARP